ncbi:MULTISPECIES: L-lactate dehydrogenase [Halocynthiibacter]|uniref:L-lactate dehydrogenase n=1 Tax=Halocynthiibacter halioticoli TaxID=2986804 RepID=A0AAE3IXV9_9RHOB|nr:MULTISPECIES: L-lactate dehydrogenase [Halocynthiibacter]MCV6822923.1 L-lactate dehydrogenase [Halocynthiibacter halioticoli]MCW4055924.1 L-lactate dehydrogenase [Halocynthiibacter sp. SDUM655004]
MPTMNLVPVTSEDYRRIAERKLPRFLFDYVDGGAYDEATLRRNVSDFARIEPKQRVMRDVSNVTTNGMLAGENCEMPLALAPVGMGGMLARRAEVQAKRAADAAGVPFTLSTVSICALEEIASVSSKPFWFQLYMLRDRAIVQEILDRAWDVGVRTLVFTVDLAVVGERYRDVRNGIAGGASAWGKLRAGLLSYLSHPQWAIDVGIKGKPHTFGNLTKYVPAATDPSQYREWVGSQFDASVTWKDIEWLRGIWNGKLIIKGVLSSEDAHSAAEAGADGVIVSNHGGRQLDGVASSISVLPGVRDKIDGRAEVLLDGGIRSGLDVFRAKALGADGVLIGRPWAYAVAAGGEDGVENLLTAMRRELTVAMALCGVDNMNDINSDLVVARPR